MSQQDVEQTTVVSSSPIQEPETEPDGPPRTPYKIAAFVLTAVMATYSWVFKMWDGSEFPETFAHPAYWLFLGLVLLLAGMWALFVSNRRRRLDSFVVWMLFLASAGTFTASVLVHRQAKPSEKIFTVVLFSFSDHTNKNIGSSFRDNIQRELEAKYKNEILVLPRDREIKGEKLEEKVLAARSWGSRRSGCHLAVWAELSTAKDGQNYMIDLHYVSVYPFGTQLNHGEVEGFPFDEVNRSFLARPAGSANAVGPDAIVEPTGRIALSCGLASYDKGDYDTALRILSNLGTAHSEYFAGRAALLIAVHSTHARQLFKEAETHYLKAISLDRGENGFDAPAYIGLGRTYDFMFVFRITAQPKDDEDNATAAYSKAAEIYKKSGVLSSYSDSLVGQASAIYRRSTLEQGQVVVTRDLNDAEGLLHEALKYIGEKSGGYSDAQNTLGFIYLRRGDYQKAIHTYETALRFADVEGKEYRSRLRYLGEAQTAASWQTYDEALYEDGIGNLRRASQFCQSGSVDLNCHSAHMSAGTASFRWAERFRGGSPAWTREIERSIDEFAQSSNFVSKTDHAQLYAESKEKTARAITERASSAHGDQRLSFLRAALAALSDGIDALTGAAFDAKQLYEKRAQCYDRLRLDSTDQVMKSEYLRLARQDREAAKGSTPKLMERPSPRFR